jgi:hypothetical protein
MFVIYLILFLGAVQLAGFIAVTVVGSVAYLASGSRQALAALGGAVG